MKILLVFIKYPEPGRVKTRLARSVGDAAAADLYRRMAERTVREAHRVRAIQMCVMYDPPGREVDIRGWLGAGIRYRPQRGTGLGERLAAAFNASFAEGADRVVAIGSDCPGLRAPVLSQALDALETHQAVVGPARDGGYYLLGLRQAGPEVFRGIAWSTGRVFRQTRERIAALGWTCRVLPTLSDVDTVSDAASLRRGRREFAIPRSCCGTGLSASSD